MAPDSIEGLSTTVISLLDKLQIERFSLLGFSMGGIISQEIYKISPEKVKSFILASTIFYIPTWLEKLLSLSNKKYAKMTVEQFKEEATLRCLYDKSDEMIQKVMPNWSSHLDGFLPSWKACIHIDYRETLKNIKVPTLIISCQNDKICPSFMQKIMHKLIPNSKRYLIKKAGHVAKIEKNEEFNRVVLNFLLELQRELLGNDLHDLNRAL